MTYNINMNEIKELIKQLNMTQKEFAYHYGIPLRTVQEWTQGRRVPPQYVICMIKKIVNMEEIMGKLLKFNEIEKESTEFDPEVRSEVDRIERYISDKKCTSEFEIRKGKQDYEDLLDFLAEIK